MRVRVHLLNMVIYRDVVDPEVNFSFVFLELVFLVCTKYYVESLDCHVNRFFRFGDTAI